MSQLTLHVSGISCGHCKVAIEGAVRPLAGVERVQVDVKGKTVEVAFDAASTGRDAIVAAIEEQGYDVDAG